MKLAFCPECASSLTFIKGAHYRCDNGHDYWNNPRAAVTVIPIKDGEILLARRAHEPQKGKHDVIGGFMEPGETALQAARREFREETGVEVSSLTYAGSIANHYEPGNYTCDSVYVVNDFTEQVVAGDDVEELAWQAPDVLQSDRFAWPAYRNVLPLIEPYL